MQPELSIVIPFRNEEHVLSLVRERFEKILNRSADYELLFVGDGSTDGSTQFIEAWLRRSVREADRNNTELRSSKYNLGEASHSRRESVSELSTDIYKTIQKFF